MLMLTLKRWPGDCFEQRMSRSAAALAARPAIISAMAFFRVQAASDARGGQSPRRGLADSGRKQQLAHPGWLGDVVWVYAHCARCAGAVLPSRWVAASG